MKVRCTAVVSFAFVFAALMRPSPALAQPVLSVSPTSFNLQASAGSNVTAQSVQISNAGKRALKWSIVQPTAKWLTVSPTSGTNSGTLTLTFQTSALVAGEYQTSFRVDSNAGSATSVAVRVSMLASPTTDPPSSDWTLCASEGGFCAFTGTKEVRYGANTSYVYKTLSDGVACTNAVFGDPLPGVVKHCDTGQATTSDPAPNPTPSDWTFCASEGGFCGFTGTKEVRYGANTSYVYRTLSDGVACTNAVFGDPLPGVAKHCDTGQASTSDPAPSEPTVQTTVYVSTSGSDTNSGAQSSPVRTIQRGVQLADQANAAGLSSRVSIAGGIYRQSVTLDAGQKTDAPMILEGAGASTVLTGADVWTAWSQLSDGSLTHHWPYKWGMKPIPNGWSSYWNWDGNGYKRDVLRRSEMVYVNGQALRGVLSLTELAAGTFYVNESTERLHVRLPSGVALSQATIEVGMRLHPIRINGRRNLTLRNFAVMRSRGAVQDTAVTISNSRNITLDQMAVRWMAYGAYGSSYNTTIRIHRSVFSDNGVGSIEQFRDIDVLIEDSEIARNNWRGWPAEHKGWGTGHKWSGVRDGVVRRTRFVNNMGHGFWVDSDNRRVTLQNSLISANALNGVNVEKNQGPLTIEGNRICNNTQAGLSDAQSDRVTLRNNQIWGTARWNTIFTGNYAGQTVTDWQTGESVTTRSRYWTVDGNIVAGSGSEGWLLWHTDHNAPGAWSLIRSTFVKFDNNRWYHSGRSTAFRLPQGNVSYPAFQTDVQQADAMHELNSRWEPPPTLSCTLP